MFRWRVSATSANGCTISRRFASCVRIVAANSSTIWRRRQRNRSLKTATVTVRSASCPSTVSSSYASGCSAGRSSPNNRWLISASRRANRTARFPRVDRFIRSSSSSMSSLFHWVLAIVIWNLCLLSVSMSFRLVWCGLRIARPSSSVSVMILVSYCVQTVDENKHSACVQLIWKSRSWYCNCKFYVAVSASTKREISFP